MSFEFDFDDLPEMPELDKIDRQDKPHSSENKPVPVKIDYDLCEVTGVCAQVCPEDVIEFTNGTSHVAKPEACTECWICVENCVSGAIEIV